MDNLRNIKYLLSKTNNPLKNYRLWKIPVTSSLSLRLVGYSSFVSHHHHHEWLQEILKFPHL
jgi:hypothetical protein